MVIGRTAMLVSTNLEEEPGIEITNNNNHFFRDQQTTFVNYEDIDLLIEWLQEAKKELDKLGGENDQKT